MTQDKTISVCRRLQACAQYGGWFPWFWRSRLREDPFLRLHYRQALMLLLVFMGIFLIDFSAFLLLSAMIVFSQDLYSIQVDGYITGVIRKLWICGAVFWCYGVLTALFASQRPMPLLRKLSDYKLSRKIAVTAWGIVLSVVLLLLPVALHAVWITPAPSDTGKAWFLYDDLDRLPRSLFSVGFYPMTRAAQQRWGHDEVVLVKLSKATLTQAMGEAEFLFIASHGGEEGLVIDKQYMAPDRFSNTPVNPSLQFVYMAGCDAGTLETEWKALFAPGEVILFDRYSATVEHIWWMWRKGPKVIRND